MTETTLYHSANADLAIGRIDQATDGSFRAYDDDGWALLSGPLTFGDFPDARSAEAAVRENAGDPAFAHGSSTQSAGLGQFGDRSDDQQGDPVVARLAAYIGAQIIAPLDAGAPAKTGHSGQFHSAVRPGTTPEPAPAQAQVAESDEHLLAFERAHAAGRAHISLGPVVNMSALEAAELPRPVSK